MRMANKRLSQVGGSVNTTPLWASRWQWMALLLLVIPVLALALTLSAKPALAQNSERAVRSANGPELVFDRDCVEVVKPSPDFQLHVPLNKNGDPVDALIYSTGKLNFKVKALDCAKVAVRPETAAKGAKEGEKKACCDFGQ